MLKMRKTCKNSQLFRRNLQKRLGGYLFPALCTSGNLSKWAINEEARSLLVEILDLRGRLTLNVVGIRTLEGLTFHTVSKCC